MLSTATVTMDLSDLLGVDFDARRTKVWISTNVPNDTVIDTADNKIRLGSGTVTVSADGTASLTVWTPGAEANPSSWQTYIHVDYPDRQAHGGRGKRTFGPFTITASTDLADLVDEQEVPAEYVTTLTTALDGYVTDAEAAAAVAQSAADLASAITGLEGADDAVTLLDATPSSAFRIAQDARLADTYAPTTPATAILFGTSQEFNNGPGVDAILNAVTTYDVSTRGWWNWCKSYLGHRLDLIRNAGVSGNRSAQMLARIDADVLAYDPGWVIIGGPTNDMMDSLPAATTIANMTAIYNKLKGRARIVQLTMGPRTDIDTTNKNIVYSKVNEWLVNAPTLFPHVMVVDIHRLFVDPTTGQPVSGALYDGIHYTEYAAHRIGHKVAQTLLPYLAPRPRRSVVRGNTDNVLGDPGMLLGSWGITTIDTSTITFPNDPETFANYAQMVITGNTGGTQEHTVGCTENTSGGRWVPGNKVRAEVRIQFSGLQPVDLVNARRFQPMLRLQTRHVDNTFLTFDQALGLASVEVTKQLRGLPTDGELVLRTPWRVIPAGADRLYFNAGWLGAVAGTVKVFEPTIVKA